MPTYSRFGDQPAKKALTEERWSQPRAAEKINVPFLHLRGALNGHVAPSKVVRDRLPALLGRPLSELFTAEALAATYHGNRGPQSRKRDGEAWATSWDRK